MSTGLAGGCNAPVTTAPSTSPTTSATRGADSRSTRLASIDVARALALLGMFIVHAVMVWSPNSTGWAAGIEHHLEGRSMPLFMVLSGVGLDLLLAGTARPWRTMLGRSAVLLIVGLWLSGHTPVAVIIPYYAVYLLLGTALRKLSDTGLLVASGSIMVVGSALRFHVEHFPAPWVTSGPDALGRLGVLASPVRLVSELFVVGLYPALPASSLVVLGMWISRRIRRCAAPADRSRLATRLIVVGVALVAVTNLTSALTESGRQTAILQRSLWTEVQSGNDVATMLEEQAAAAGMSVDEMLQEEAELTGTPIEELRAMTETEPAPRIVWPWMLVMTDAHSELPGWLLSASGSSVAVIGLCLAWEERRRRGRVLAALAPLGRSSLSAYALHIGVIWVILQVRPGEVSAPASLGLAAAAWLIMVVLALVWSRYLGQAPLERLMRRAGKRSAALTLRRGAVRADDDRSNG